MEKAKKRGVSIKIAATITSENIKVARDLAKIADMRALKKSHGRFIIVDDDQMMFMVLDDKTVHPNYDVGIWITSGFFAKSLGQMIQASWKDFIPLSKVKV